MLGVGDSEDQAFWAALFKGLRSLGLAGVALVISDHHLSLESAIESVGTAHRNPSDQVQQPYR